MEQREKLIELIGTALESHENDKCRVCAVYDCAKCVSECIADHLLANGVVVLPCKVGDTVYEVVRVKKKFENPDSNGFIRELKVSALHLNHGTTKQMREKEYLTLTFDGRYSCRVPFAGIGKTVFLTREEAEKALGKRKGGDE